MDFKQLMKSLSAKPSNSVFSGSKPSMPMMKPQGNKKAKIANKQKPRKNIGC